MNLQQVHLRVNDAATGKPTPVRIRITDADGKYYAPFGRLTEFATGVNQDVGGNVLIGVKKWSYIDGACEILVPPGQLHVEITKGFEYTPIDEDITLLPGKMALRFTIQRWCDTRSQGWYSGDTRVHFLSPDAALLEGAGEDVAVVNVLAKETTIKDSYGKAQRAIPNLISFSGQALARESSTCAVAINTQNVHPMLGSLGLLHCHRVVHPLTFDSTDWTLDDWCGQCHRKKGLVVWTNPQHQTADFLYGEPLANAILGAIDAFELTFFEDSPFDALADYYRLLDAGVVLPLVGASSKDRNAQALGAMRTYASLGRQEFSYGAWIEAVRQGLTYITNGPLLRFGLAGPGSDPDPMVLRLAPGEEGLTMQPYAEVISFVPFDRLELLWNGKVLATARPFEKQILGINRAEAGPLSGPPWRASIETEFIPRTSGWLAVRCIGDTLVPGCPAPQRVFAHSSPVAIILEERPNWARPEAIQMLDHELESMARWADERRWQRLAYVVQKARTVLATKVSS